MPTIVAVAGPSGSGKDAVLGYARERLSVRPNAPLFARRAITRDAAPGEDHIPMSEPEFAAARARGEFALSWDAHGLSYGIPSAQCRSVGAEGLVVANLSRAVLPHLETQFERAYTVLVTVSPEIRAARIASRGRELGTDAALRVARPDPVPEFGYDLTIVNDADLACAGERLVGFLQSLRVLVP